MGDQIVAPILMQRKCDGGKDHMSQEEWARLIAERLAGHFVGFTGCGTVFQWWWGSGCVCPGCGRTLLVTLDDLKKYMVRQSVPRLNEQAIEERVLRNVLARLGRF